MLRSVSARCRPQGRQRAFLCNFSKRTVENSNGTHTDEGGRVYIKLKMIGGKHAGQKIEVRCDKFLIGRGDECHLRPSSEMVSRRHCALVVERDSVRICDFKSSNGTFVNDVRIKGEQALAPNDRVKVGPLEFAVLFTPADDSNKTAAGATSTVADVASVGKPKPDDFIQEWLTDVPASPSKETVSLKVDETHAKPNAPSARPKTPSATQPPHHKTVAGTKPGKLPTVKDPQLIDPDECEDSSGAASAAISGFLARRETNKRRDSDPHK
jgi:pSer/pThr/pTyr-binding forkhead associated (FHA) protein